MRARSRFVVAGVVVVLLVCAFMLPRQSPARRQATDRAGLSVLVTTPHAPLSSYQRAIALADELLRAHPRGARLLRARALALRHWADTLADAGDRSGAVARTREAILAFEAVDRLPDETVADRVAVATLYVVLGDRLARVPRDDGDTSAITRAYGRAVALLRDMQRAYPDDVAIAMQLDGARLKLATVERDAVR